MFVSRRRAQTGPLADTYDSAVDAHLNDTKRSVTHMKKGFNFSVIVFPSGETLNQELSFIKAAVLYADQVNLISPSIWNFLQRYQWAENLDRAEILNAFVKILEPRADQLDADQVLLSVVRSAHFRNQLKARLEKDELEKQLMNGMLSVTKSAYSAFIDRDYPEIMRLLRSNQLTIEEFTYPIEDYGIFSAEFFEKTRAAVTGATYPVLDEQTNGVLKSAAENRRIDLSESATKRVVHAQAADLILRRLPTFEKATLDELVDIKRTLATPLARFRGKMLGFTDSIETRPWDADFAPDCNALYTKEVAPAIADIRAAVDDNKVLANLGRKFTSDKDALKTLGFLSVCVAAPGVLPGFAGVDLASMLGGGALALATVSQALRDYRLNQRRIESNDLYFYFQAGETLLRRHRRD
jgi:hypothetical protein